MHHYLCLAGADACCPCMYCQVLCIEYPLAPEHRFPAALVETAAAYTWLTQQLQGKHSTVVGGELGAFAAVASKEMS